MRSSPDELEPRGCAVCVVELVDVRIVLPSDAAAACAKRLSRDELDLLWAWIMRGARRLRPSPVPGKLGLFELNPDASPAALARRPLGAGYLRSLAVFRRPRWRNLSPRI